MARLNSVPRKPTLGSAARPAGTLESVDLDAQDGQSQDGQPLVIRARRPKRGLIIVYAAN